MNIQPELFAFTNDLPHNYTKESKEAAAAAKEGSARQREMVYDYIRSRGPGGATREEVCEALCLGGDSVRPRIWELMGNNGHDMLIRKTGHTRKTNSNRNAAILEAIR